ncbi:ATP-dependent DNA helicase RecG [Alkalimonas collagenimarina]|uniref:ATP-dependent DNA helicase RecG n=1 Tax=Alkalimonas collagenimarina TaxID=400390 RepID=A0ABT9H3E5_9GAMM|nr:ATP-dependent DNA helicase RecG [Alkalimonas collagenimarina]MDP4537845.1 ATP-dependent DNA helicase RecG [Alkalimonas collagenimarina]
MAGTRLDNLTITQLKGVGAKVAEKLHKLAIFSVQDLLFHLPLRYEDRTRVCPIAALMPAMHTTVLGTVLSSEIQFGKRRSWLVKIKDHSGSLTLRFFHFSAAQKQAVTPGVQLRCFGEAKRGPRGLEMMHPEYRVLADEQDIQVEETLTPIYPSTEGLKQGSWRNLTQMALQHLQQFEPQEYLPVQGQQGWSLAAALQYLHRPPPDASLNQLEQGLHPAQRRLILEELTAQQISMYQLRAQCQAQHSTAISPSAELSARFLQSLNFKPTKAQYRVVTEIQHDLQQNRPMLRLVQGDVGSGKTLVAALAALHAIGAGYQVAMMAPTELLAEQHAENFRQWFEPLGIQIAWLGGKSKGKARQQQLELIQTGQAAMVIGTHALFQQDVHFHQLALAIIDEQHRFGVHQRLALREKGSAANLAPHQLIMTATPIPRTLAMTAYADLDTSIIDELPPGRTPVTTVAIPDSRRQQVIDRVKQVVQQEQRQVYWVCTLIEESDVLQCQAAEQTAEALKQSLPDLQVGLVHGRLKASEKQQVMQAFSHGDLDVLVATTVIEVGVNVPNASLMIIENPERLGLAQLHQLRGRVGRGSTASHCVLLYHAPLSHTAQSRLAVLRNSNDGFVIAQRDLEIRGPGELLGTRQTGLMQFKIADLERDEALLPDAQYLAEQLWQQDQHACQQLLRRWLPNRERFANA